MTRDKTRRGFLTVAGAGTLTALAGCLGDSDDSSEDTPGSESSSDDGSSDDDSTDNSNDNSSGGSGGTLEMMATGSIQTLDPINAKGSGAGYNQYNQQLMYFPDGEYPPEPALATGYDVSDDGLTYTFNLREDVTFHDGTEFTADDVVYSYRRLAESSNSRNKDDIVGETLTIAHEKDPSLSEPTDEETLDDVVPGSLAVEAVDDYTVEMTLESPFQYTLSSFSDYYGGEPELDEIRYTVVGSGNTRLQRFSNGNADILESVPTASFNPSDVSIASEEGNRSLGTYTLDNGTEVNYGEIPALTTEYIVFNTLKVPLPVRRAFAYAMNQHDIAENVYKGTGKPAYHIVPPAAYPIFEDGISGEESYDRHAENGYESNTEFAADGYPYGYGETRLDDARAVMEEAGYGDDDRYEVTATTIAGDSGYSQVFTRLQSKLRSAYIDMEIVEAEFGTIISKAISGEMAVFGLGDGMEYPGPQNFLRFLHGQNPSSQFTRWGAEDSYATAEYRQTAREAWDSNYAAQGTTQDDHMEAFQTVEEMNWASVQELPFLHPKSQRFWHTDVDVDMYGVMENQAFDDTVIDG